jgi:membrane associated rhomboid family serine protease
LNTSITIAIILFTSLFSLLGFYSAAIREQFIFRPTQVEKKGQWFRFITSGFLHADWEHLLFNMLTLFLFGDLVEKQFYSSHFFSTQGGIYFGLLYGLALPIALLPTYVNQRKNNRYASLGASGAVSAIIFAAILLDPTIKVGLFLIPPIIPGFIFGPLYLLISAKLGSRGRDHINHAAHITGALFGLFFTIIAATLTNSPADPLAEFISKVEAYLR